MPLHRPDQTHIPYDEFDPEVVDICRKMNSLPGLRTTSSCCGHGREPFTIFFQVSPEDPRGLFILTRCADRRYWEHGHKWSITLSVGDVCVGGRLPVDYMLISSAKGTPAYVQAQSLCENIDYHLAHENFMTGFGLRETWISPADRVREALAVAAEGVKEGDHHKQWVIDQMVRALTACPMVPYTYTSAWSDEKVTTQIRGESPEYQEWVAALPGEWEEGVAP